MQTIFPFLRYSDAAAAIAWLVEAFGCERHEVHEAADGTIVHAELRLGSDIFMLGTAADDFLGMKTPRQLGAVNQGLYVVVEDPDAPLRPRQGRRRRDHHGAARHGVRLPRVRRPRPRRQPLELRHLPPGDLRLRETPAPR